MHVLFDELERSNAQAEKSKTRMQETARDVERLRVERAAAESEVKQMRLYDEDERVMGLYDW